MINSSRFEKMILESIGDIQHSISDEHGRSSVPKAMHDSHRSLEAAGYKRVGFHSGRVSQTHYYEHSSKPAVSVSHFHDGDQATVSVLNVQKHVRDAHGRPISSGDIHSKEQGKGHQFISSIK